MTLKQLEAFYWSAILGSFALAAERLFMTQSALSKRIQELELEIGIPLFDRTGPRARITEAGQNILGRVENLLALRDEIVLAARGPIGLQGTCRFGISELMAMQFLPKIVAAARAAFPDVVVEPRVAVTRELLDDVEKGETEFALAPGTSENPDVLSLPIVSIPLCWVAAPDLVKGKTSITSAELQAYPIISMSAQAGSSLVLQSFSAQHDLRFRRILASNSPEAVASVTMAGLGIALLAEPFVKRFIDTGQLLRVDIEDQPAVSELQYSIHWRADNKRVLAKKIRELAYEICTRPVS